MSPLPKHAMYNKVLQYKEIDTKTSMLHLISSISDIAFGPLHKKLSQFSFPLSYIRIHIKKYYINIIQIIHNFAFSNLPLYLNN